VLIANRVSAQCLAFLLSNSLPGAFDIIALKTPGITESDRMEVLADLTTLTGGRPFHAAAGDSLLTVQLADLGGARRVWADRTHFGVIGGTGEPRARITYIRQLEREFDRACDDELRRRLSQRIGILTGSSAVVRIGGNPEPPVRKRIEDARQLVMSIRAAMRDGTVPGGGYALYSARHALLPAGRELDPDERAAQGILLHALEAPIRHILANAGHNFGHQVLVDLDEQDAMQMSVQGDAAGLIADLSDSALTTKTVVRAAIEGAAQALTIDTVVHHRYPEESIHP
jgi:chaperonin GroEL